jgi:hypothetical protein
MSSFRIDKERLVVAGEKVKSGETPDPLMLGSRARKSNVIQEKSVPSDFEVAVRIGALPSSAPNRKKDTSITFLTLRETADVNIHCQTIAPKRVYS